MISVYTFVHRCVSIFLFVFLFVAAAFAQTTVFTYQGKPSDGASAANGSYDMQFRLYNTATPNTGTKYGGDAIFSAATNNAVSVSNGVFTVKLDFNSTPFAAGASHFLEIGVKKAADADYTILTAREQITASPYAVRTLSANAADSLSAACVSCVTNEKISSVDGAKVTGTVGNASTANTAKTAGNVSGVVAIVNGGTGSATQNFVDLTTDQTVGGNKTFSGILSGDGSGLRNISGANVAGSVALNPQRLAILRWYDVNQATFAQRIAVGSNPYALAFDGTFVYAANYSSNTVQRF